MILAPSTSHLIRPSSSCARLITRIVPGGSKTAGSVTITQ